MIHLEVYDKSGMQYLPAARSLRFDKAMEGGEDVSCGFVLDRSGRVDWPDVGYGYEVVLREDLKPIWAGHMRHIEQDVDTITVTALGNWVHLHDLTYIGGGATPGTIGRLWSDTRYERWKPATDDLIAGRTPERYEFDQQNRLFIAPRKGENFGPIGTAHGGLYYLTLYDDVKRITFNYNFVNPSNWVGWLRSFNAGWGAGNTEWTIAVTGAGAQNIVLVNARAILLFEMYYNAAAANYGGETGACRLRITNLYLYGTSDTTPTVTDVATDIVAQLSGSGVISGDTSLIETIAMTLQPLFYERGESCLDALEDAASFGDANYRRLAWGVESGGDRVFVRTPDRDNVRYVIPPGCATNMGARGEAHEDFVTEGWGMYADEEGVTQYTAKYYAHVTQAGIVVNTTSTGNDLASTVYGIRRDRVVDFGRVSAALATAYIQRYLIEHAHPQVTSRWQVVGRVQDLAKGGAWISPHQMETGWLVQVPHFRAVEAEGAAGVDLREWETTFMLAGLSWDDDNKRARLTPEGASTDLQKIVELVRRFTQEKQHDKMAKRI